jgi:ubiquinone/menaquinone biosynthesis C-methylase UbiE
MKGTEDMTDQHKTTTHERKRPSQIFHPRFAAFYEWFARLGQQRRLIDPLREASAGQAYGIVVELGAGNGLNFSWYQPARVERVEAVEPDSAMLAYARARAGQAAVPITLTQASVEALPWASATFDSAVATLVFCSVSDPVRGLAEIKRVMKPGGTLFLFEHVRSKTGVIAQVQDALAPVTTRLFGNCHWNRDAEQLVREAGFQVAQVRSVGGDLALMPHLLLEAKREREEKE